MADLRYSPPVALSALSLSALPSLHFARFTLATSRPPASPLSARARWLEHGLGPPVALPVAAAALLSDHLPSALPAVIASPAPSLWVFAAPPVLARAVTLLAPALVPAAPPAPLRSAPPAQLAAPLRAALHRALAAALAPDGLLPLGDLLHHPSRNLSYALRLHLPPDRPALAHLRVRKSSLRPLNDADSRAAHAGTRIPVVAAPLALTATLANRPPAGDALSASVLARWREAGLLHPTPLRDNAVVFLALPEGPHVPFPRACVLTEHPPTPNFPSAPPAPASPTHTPAPASSKKQQLPATTATAPHPSKHSTPKSARAKAAARSRKRPRSPPVASKPPATAKPEPVLTAKAEPVLLTHDPLVNLHDRFAADAPTAESLNYALDLAKKQGKTDPVPVLHHPLVDAVAPPVFEPPEDKLDPVPAKAHRPGSGGGGTISETQSGPTAGPKAAASVTTTAPAKGNAKGNSGIHGQQQVTDKQTQAAPDSTKPNLSKRSESSDGIDAFLLDGDTSSGQGGFDSGPGMDMTDFAVFDDDVTKFFGSSMDERLPETDNQASNLNASGHSMQQQSQTVAGASRLTDQEANQSYSNSDVGKLMRESQMDVDTEVQKVPGNTHANAARESDAGSRGLYSQDVMAMALSALRKQGVAGSRPDGTALGSKLSGFFEDDLTDRRLGRLGPVGSIGKRQTRSKLMTRKLYVRSKNDAYSMRRIPPNLLSNAASFYGLPSNTSYKVRSNQKRENLVDLYVPQRRMKRFIHLRNSGKVIHPSSRLALSDSDDSDSSGYEEDEDAMPQVGATNRGNISRAANGENLNGDSGNMLRATSDVSGGQKKATSGQAGKDRDKQACDPVKIVESVAVDCASACMVLAASRLSTLAFSPVSVEPVSPPALGEANGSSSTTRDEDSGKSNGPHHSDTKPALTPSVSKSSTTNHVGSPIHRNAFAAKREREMLSLLTILEMQAFCVQELDLFREADLSQKRETFALGSRQDPTEEDKSSSKVPSATVRRVLYGLPRILETSRVLGSCSESLRDFDKESPGLRIEGPVAVSDVLGESASVFPLDLPRVCVGYNKDWIETPSAVLPIWEKTGLEPFCDPKNVEYVAVAPKDMEADVRLFLRDLSAAYKECTFGRHSSMPFDAVTLIANSVVKTDQKGRMKNPDLLSDVDRAMAEQYHLAITGLCTKLAAVTREHRKGASGTATNIVAYVVSPFENGDVAANVALLRAVAPLVSSIPGTVPSTVTMLGSGAPGVPLPSAPWRSSPAAKTVVSITVRILPREVVDRQLCGHVQIKCLLERSLRPQLMKAISFAVYNSIRSKRVRTSHVDGEVAGMLARTSLMPDDLMSPMTPDIVAESPGGNPVAPVSPKATSSDENSGSPSANAATLATAFVDQSSALSPSFLHEPAIVLDGVGKHMGQTDGRADMVFHLAYSYCESSSRYVFVWTSESGEMLDIATVPVSKVAVGASRRKAFWCMWARGQRWKVSFVRDIHATISKLGTLMDEEIEDWDWVLAKVIRSDAGSPDKQSDEQQGPSVVRRFPPVVEQPRGDDISDLYTDHPTPATPGTSQPAVTGSSAKSTVSLDTKMPTISSITILNVCEADEHLLLQMPEATNDADRRGFAIVSDGSDSGGQNVLASVILARFEERDVTALQLNLVRHYGMERQGEDMTDDRSPWDASSTEAIASSIAMNFDKLRYVGAPPCWPQERWLSSYPVHLDIARRLERQVGYVHAYAFAPNMPGMK